MPPHSEMPAKPVFMGSMRQALGSRLASGGSGSEAGLTLVELLVASAMSVVLLGAVGSHGDQRDAKSAGAERRAQNISTARWVLERMTREIRNGVDSRQGDRVLRLLPDLRAPHDLRQPTSLASTLPAIKCEVTYTCTTTSCSRIEAAPGIYTGTARTIFSGIDSENVFSYSPQRRRRRPTSASRCAIPNPSGPSASPSPTAPACATRPWPTEPCGRRIARESGFTIIEVLVAALILTIGALTTFGLLSTATKNTQRAKATPGGARPRPAGDRGAAQPLQRRAGADGDARRSRANPLNPNYRVSADSFALTSEPRGNYANWSSTAVNSTAAAWSKAASSTPARHRSPAAT